MNEPNVVGLVLTLVGKRRVSVTELTHFEPEDRSTGIFGNYIQVRATDNIEYVLDDGMGWVHPFHSYDDDEFDEYTIVGTFDNSKVWPSQDKPITPRAIITEAIRWGDKLDERADELLEFRWGIGLDTELRQA